MSSANTVIEAIQELTRLVQEDEFVKPILPDTDETTKGDASDSAES